MPITFCKYSVIKVMSACFESENIRQPEYSGPNCLEDFGLRFQGFLCAMARNKILQGNFFPHFIFFIFPFFFFQQ